MFFEGELIKTHTRIERGTPDRPGGLPAREDRVHDEAPRRGAAAGPASSANAVAEVVAELMEVNALYRLRSSPRRRRVWPTSTAPTGSTRRAGGRSQVGDPTYRTVKGILEPAPNTTATTGPESAPTAPAHLHGPARLFDVESRVMTATGQQLEDAAHEAQVVRHARHAPTRLEQAAAGELGHVELLEVLCQDETTRRDAAGLARRVKAARFEQLCPIEEFDFSFNPKIPAAAHP